MSLRTLVWTAIAAISWRLTATGAPAKRAA
jgi:hypothetical protein